MGIYTWPQFPAALSADFEEDARAALETWRANSALIDTAVETLVGTVGALVSGSGVKATANDTTVGNLTDKATVSAYITKTVQNPGGNENLLFEVDAAKIRLVKDYDEIPIEWTEEGVTATAGQPLPYEDGNGKMRAANFSGSATQDRNIPWLTKQDLYAAGVVRFRVRCLVTSATGPSGEGLAFRLRGASSGNGDGIDVTFGAAAVSTITGRTDAQYDTFLTDWSGTLTITDLAAGELAGLNVDRQHDHASDTYAQEVGVISVIVEYWRQLAGA